MKIAVLTGGGADGAFTVGRLETLNKDYDKAIGSSTGSLASVLTLLKDWDKLGDAYENTETKDITEKSAFSKDGSINIRKVITRTIRSYGKRQPKTVGESKALRKRINTFVSEADYNRLREQEKEAIVTCFSMTTESVSHFSSLTEKFEDFKDWMWASANPPIVFSLLKKAKVEGGNIEEWVDGGVGSITPISLAVLSGASEVDVFMHQPKPEHHFKKSIKNVPHFISRLFKSYYKINEVKELEAGLELAKLLNVNVNVYWMPHEYYDYSLIFGKEKMKNLRQKGREHAYDCFDNYNFR